MKLAVFTSQFPGTVATFFARDMRGLIEAGIEIDIFSIYPLNQSLWAYVPDLLNQRILPRARVHHLTISQCISSFRLQRATHVFDYIREASLIGMSAASFGFGSLGKSLYIVPKAWSWAQRYGSQFDHVLAYWGNYAGTCAYLFHRLARTSVPFSLFLHAGPDLYRPNVYMRQKLEYADKIITCSAFNRRYLEEGWTKLSAGQIEKVYVHHHGLDLEDFSYMPDGRSSRVIAVGRLEKEKGYQYLLRAIHRLKQTGARIEADIVGSGTYKHRLEALANDLELGDQVKFHGWLTPEQTKKGIREAALLVHPAADLGDGVPNVIKESMALGTPVIASSIAGIPELLENGKHGIIVPPRDEKALSFAITHLMRSQDIRRNYARTGRRHVEINFDMWRNGRQLGEVLKQASRYTDKIVS